MLVPQRIWKLFTLKLYTLSEPCPPPIGVTIQQKACLVKAIGKITN
nr:MAG TPA: hypothetical protein [Caudoviricetes sp.]